MRIERQSRYAEGERVNAREFISSINAHVGQDYHTLSGEQVDAILKEVRRVRYQKPRNANGSTARYYYERLQRHARG